MITISKPVLQKTKEATLLVATIKDDNKKTQKDIWYKTTPEYEGYLCDEVADSFVLLMLMQAVISNQDIEVQAPISQRLYYHLNTALIHLFTAIYTPQAKQKIQIRCTRTLTNDYAKQANAVACGCSLGVDSLSAIKYRTSNECPEEYRLTHLTYFNIGALGEYDLEEAERSYQKNLHLIKRYAQELSLPVVTVESNSACLFTVYDLDFDQTHTLRNACTVLAMQKLFHRYYYASSFPIDNTQLSRKYMGYYETVLLPLLSADYTEFIEADTDKTRTDKTRYIAYDPLIQKSLYVCWRDIFSNGSPSYKKQMDAIPYLNCTRCDKCLRTAITLDILGVLHQYDNLFDLDYFRKMKGNYIYQVLTEKNHNTYYQEIAELMEKEHYEIPKNIQRNLMLKKYHLLGIYRFLQRIYHKIRY